jgi:hypothetical protein
MAVTIEMRAVKFNEREARAGRGRLEHARQQGEELLVFQEQLGPREFLPWCRKHLTIGKTTIFRYKKVAERWQEIGSNLEPITTVDKAEKFLASLDEVPDPPDLPPVGKKTLGIFTGDFRKVGGRVADTSVALVFADPDYTE